MKNLQHVVNISLFTEMLVTYNSILIITALLPNLNATAPKNLLWKLEKRCSICADTVDKYPYKNNFY